MCAGWLFVCRKCPDINVRRLLIRDADSSSTIRLRVSRFLQSDLRSTEGLCCHGAQSRASVCLVIEDQREFCRL